MKSKSKSNLIIKALAVGSYGLYDETGKFLKRAGSIEVLPKTIACILVTYGLGVVVFDASLNTRFKAVPFKDGTLLCGWNEATTWIINEVLQLLK